MGKGTRKVTLLVNSNSTKSKPPYLLSGDGGGVVKRRLEEPFISHIKHDYDGEILPLLYGMRGRSGRALKSRIDERREDSGDEGRKDTKEEVYKDR